MCLLTWLRDFFHHHGCDKTYWIAYSGGLDSHVLLDLCCSLRIELSLQINVIHVNHGLSPYANHWVAHCQSICDSYDVLLCVKSIDLNLVKGDSLEEVARERRYALFAELMGFGDFLLTAHHQDDQAETVLLQLFRGAGVQGLSAMPACQAFQQGVHARPLLSIPRHVLLEYAKQRSLIWIEDESNHQLKYSRNFLRHEIMPKLKLRWPSVEVAIARSAEHCAMAQTILNDHVATLMPSILGSVNGTLSIKKILLIDEAMQRLVLRAWIQQQGHPLPDTKKLTTICQTMLLAAHDRQPHVAWQQSIIRRFAGDLYLLHKQDNVDPLPKEYTWNLRDELRLPGIGVLSVRQAHGVGLRADVGMVTVRTRRGGERVYDAARGTHSLKNLFQEWKVPTWLRDRIPLLYVGEKLVCVVGYFIDKEMAVNEGVEIVLGPMSI